MPYLNTPTDAKGPLVNVLIEVSAPRAMALRTAGQVVPQPVPLRGLIDTGADCTFVDTRHIPFLSQQTPAIVLVGDGKGGFTYAAQYDVSLTIVHPSGNRRDN